MYHRLLFTIGELFIIIFILLSIIFFSDFNILAIAYLGAVDCAIVSGIKFSLAFRIVSGSILARPDEVAS